MRKKLVSFPLRLYEERDEDRVILSGLETASNIKGDKIRIIKSILYNHFIAAGSPVPDKPITSSAVSGRGDMAQLERKESKGHKEVLQENMAIKVVHEKRNTSTSEGKDDKIDELQKNLSQLSELLL